MNTKTEKPKFFGTKTDLKNSQNRKTVNPNAPLSKNSKMLGVKKVKQILVVSTLKKLTEDSMDNMHTDIGPLSMSIEKGSVMLFKFNTCSLDLPPKSSHSTEVMAPTTTLLMNVPVRFWLLTKI